MSEVYADVLVVVPKTPMWAIWRSQRAYTFPTKMPRKMKKVVGKIFDGRHLTAREQRTWGKALRAARQRMQAAVQRAEADLEADQPVAR